ncbi:ead/Ea22-like family protein [Enterobacter hormaechei]
MSNIDKQALRWKAEKATQGEWWSDSCGNEGVYGSGDDCVEGYTSYAVYDEKNQILLDTINSTAACINEEYDGECHVAWDEVGQRNAEFIAAANPATVLALLDELEAADALNKHLELAIRKAEGCSEKLREKAEAAEKRIAELELARIALASLEAEAVTEWTNEQCLEFLSIAFRHAEIKGDLEFDDIRLGVKMVNGNRAALLQGDYGNSLWVACSERMPDNGGESRRLYLCWGTYHDGDEPGHIPAWLFIHPTYGWYEWEPVEDDCNPKSVVITHWMSLPAAPQQDE